MLCILFLAMGCAEKEDVNDDGIEGLIETEQAEKTELENLREQNCVDAEDYRRLDYSQTDVVFYTNAVSKSLKVQSSPALNSRCVGFYCESYIHDTYNRINEISRLNDNEKITSKQVFHYVDSNISSIDYWNGEQNLILTSRVSYDYNQNNNMIYRRLYKINGDNSETQTKFHYFIYNSKNLVDAMELNSIDENSNEIIIESFNYLYCLNGSLLVRQKNGQNFSKEIYKYNENGQPEAVTTFQSNGEKDRKVFYYYNTNGKIIEEHFDAVNGGGIDGAIDYIRFFEYDEYSNLIKYWGYYPLLNIYEGASQTYVYTY